MKEYKIQMKFAHWFEVEWLPAHNPYGGYMGHPYNDFKCAKQAMQKLKNAWGNNSFGKEPPIDWRIVSRTVTEWEPEAIK